MPETSEHTMTLAQQLNSSAPVCSAIDTIVDELARHQSHLSDVRGPTSAALTQRYDQWLEQAAEVRGRPLFYPYLGSGLGSGPFVELADGSVKIDLITGIGVHYFGHGDPDLVRTALTSATSDLVQQGNLIANTEAVRFAHLLVEQAQRGSALRHAFLTNSGAMANESALKVCLQKHAPASRVIAFEHCFMGRSWAMSQIGDSPGNRQGLPLNVLVDYMPFYDEVIAREMSAGDVSGSTRFIDASVARLEQYISRYPKQHACFIFELVQGEGGFNTALPEFHRALMDVCKANDIAVWDDEIQTFGRTTEMFCYDALGLGDLIDVLCVGKMTQVCAAMYTGDYNPAPGLLSGTFLGGTTELNVGCRMLERLRDSDLYGRDGAIARHHSIFSEGIRSLASRHPEWFPNVPQVVDIVGGFGGMMRSTPFGGKKAAIAKLCHILFDEGIIAFYCGHGPFHIRFLPPLAVMDTALWPRVFELFEQSMARCAQELEANA